MLKLFLAPYGDTAWSWNGTAYTTTDHTSRVEPYAHPMVEQLAVTDGTRTLLIIRERVAGRALAEAEAQTVTPAEYDQALALAAQWPADHVRIETAPQRPVRVSAGTARTTPLYVAKRDGVLHGSWDMADLRAYASELSPREAARLLIYRPRYGFETLFTGIRRLTERATAIFGGALHLHYPEPALHCSPRDLADGADVLTALASTIDRALDVRPLDPAFTVFHLTGGFDSGTIATRAAQRWPGQVDTAALVVIGAGREQQMRRRKKMLAQIPFSGQDLLVDCAARPPLHPSCPRVAGEIISPYEEPLFTPFARLTGMIADHGARTLVTGLGGDEMVALSPEESAVVAAANAHITDKLPWLGAAARSALPFSEDAIAPPAVVNSITLLSLETTAPPLLRAGIWPVHPFTDPAMIALGEQLPIYWREFKNLQRRHLAAFGLDEDVTNPVERESFVWLVEHSLKTYGIPLINEMLAGGSPLIEAGLVDPDGLRATVAEVESQPYDEEFHAKLLQVIDLHLAARAFLS